MKNKLVILFIAVVSFVSCNDILDATPDGRVTLDKVFQDPELTAKYLSNCYNNLPKKGFWYFAWTNIPIGVSDEAWDCDDGQGLQAAALYKGMASSNRHPLEEPNDYLWEGLYWTKYWNQIRSINVFLERIATANVESEEIRDRYQAEAKVLRAFFYLQLIKWYGELPLLTSEIPLGYDYSKLKKSSFVDCARQIVTDCDEAIASNSLPWRITAQAEALRMTKGVAAAIRSQASLFAASPRNNNGENLWNWAYQVSSESLKMLEEHGYELYTVCHNPDLYINAYEEYFVEDADLSATPRDKETIYQAYKRAATHNVIRGLPIQGGFYMAGDVPTQELVDSYDVLSTGKSILNLAHPYLDDTKLKPNYNPGSGYDPQNPYQDRDPRFKATVHYNGSKVWVNGVMQDVQTFVGGSSTIDAVLRFCTRTGYYSRKYMHPHSGPSVPAGDGNWKYYRLGEIYLNVAEAAAESGKLDEAMRCVNIIRHRAGFSKDVDVKATSKEEAVLLVRHERRVELAYEEHRFFDTRRWCTPDEDNECEKYATGMRITKSGNNLTYTRILVGTDGSSPSKMTYERKYHYLPIPLDEVVKLESQTGEKWQNYGW